MKTEKEINTIILGDALKLIKEIPDDSIDLIFTDPPYGVDYSNNDLQANINAALGRYSQEKRNPILSDKNHDFIGEFFIEANRVMKKEGACCCCCSGGGPKPIFADWTYKMDENMSFYQALIWDKTCDGTIGLGWRYRRSYDFILTGYKKNGKMTWYGGNSESNMIRIPRGDGKSLPNNYKLHPTQKPVKLVEYFIKNHSKPGDIVLDPFAGSGTTGVAAKKNGRKYILFELDEKYYNIARHRLTMTQKMGELNDWID